jgi:hypothetical protein
MLATRAEDWKAAGEFDWHVTGGKGYEMEKGHIYWIGERASPIAIDALLIPSYRC